MYNKLIHILKGDNHRELQWLIKLMIESTYKKRIILYMVLLIISVAITTVSAFLGGLVFRIAAVIFGFISVSGSVALVYCIIARLDLMNRIYGFNEDFAVIISDKRRKCAYISENAAHVTGIMFSGRVIPLEDSTKIIAKLTAEPLKSAENIYAAAAPDKWVKYSRSVYKHYEIHTFLDVTDSVSSRQIINSLQAYDTDTGVLSREAFINAVRNSFDSEPDNIILIHFILSGMDKLISFSGSSAADEVVASVAQYLKKLETAHGIYSGRTSTYAFSMIIPNSGNSQYDPSSVFDGLKSTIAALPETHRSYIRTYCGYSSGKQKETSPEKLMSESDFAAFDAESSASQTPVPFNRESYTKLAQEFAKIQVFTTIISRGLIDHHFQPIVNAHTGDIYGYEALMRPREVDGIKLTPLEVLDIAERQDMLYEIERITFTNTLRLLSENQDFFTQRKLFINCIPNSLLSEYDYNNLYDSFGAFFDKVVVEITEGSQVLDSAITSINRRFRSHNAQIALDDYGTGYSNDSTLLSVKPDYIKIDRSLISCIDTDPQKQHLVANLIGFASQHSIVTLAEGIETEEELRTVISLGVDLIQGYYTCKATAVIMLSLPVEIKNHIVDINLQRIGHVRKTYDVNGRMNVNVVDIALLGYTEIAVHGGSAIIKGDPSLTVGITMRVDDGIRCYIKLENVNLSGTEGPVLTVGKNSSITLDVTGKNTFNYEGIRVPSESKIFITGKGNLNILCTHNNPVGLGGSYIQDYGSITVDLDGTINISGKGDSLIGIGGGLGNPGSTIQIVNGDLDFNLRGIDVTGIGSYSGETTVKLNPIAIKMIIGAQKAVGIGSKNGNVQLECAADLDVDISGDTCCGIGTLENGSGNVSICGKNLSKIFMHAKDCSAIGAVRGRVECTVNTGYLDILCEGDKVVGIGDSFGSGNVRIGDISVRVVSKASTDNTIYVRDGKVYVFSGNIITSGISPIECYSQDGIRLKRFKIEGTRPFRDTISCSVGAYVYSARPLPDTAMMCVYLPENYKNDSCILSEEPAEYMV